MITDYYRPDWKLLLMINEGANSDCNFLICGAISGAITDPSRQEDHAIKYYIGIRKRKDDVDKISSNTGYSKEVIQSIKKLHFH